MAILLALIGLVALSAIAGPFLIKGAQKRRADRRHKLFQIAAGNLEGVDLDVPPLPGKKPPQKKSWRRRREKDSETRGGFFSFGRSDGYLDRQTRELRAHLIVMPDKVDRVLQANQAMRDQTTRIKQTETAYSAVFIKNPERPLDEPKFGKWWSETVQLITDKRATSRAYNRAYHMWDSLLKDIQKRTAALKKLLADTKDNDKEFLNDEATQAYESAGRILEEIGWADKPSVNATVPMCPNEPDPLNAEAEELCAQLPELAQELVAATRKGQRLFNELAALRSKIEQAQTGQIQVKEPHRPNEQEVQQFVSSALHWVTLYPTLLAEFDPARLALTAALEEADAIAARMTLINDKLADFEQETPIIYEDELPPPKPEPTIKAWGPLGNLGSKGPGTGGSDPLRPGQPVGGVELGKVSPFKPAPYQPGKFSTWGNSWGSGFGNGANPSGVGYRSDLDRFGRPKPIVIVEPAYETPEAPRVRKRWFITDQSQAIREAAWMVVQACANDVLNGLRSATGDIFRPEEPQHQEADGTETEKRAAVLAAMRKIGFAIGQLKAARDKKDAHRGKSSSEVHTPSLDIEDANTFVQAIGVWHAQMDKHNAEKAALDEQATILAGQIDERQSQLLGACRSAADTLSDNGLLYPDIPEVLVDPVKALRLVTLRCNQHMTALLQTIQRPHPDARLETLDHWDKQRSAEQQLQLTQAKVQAEMMRAKAEQISASRYE